MGANFGSFGMSGGLDGSGPMMMDMGVGRPPDSPSHTLRNIPGMCRGHGAMKKQ
jgi:hypothetical protein